MEPCEKLLEYLDNCLLPKLAKNIDETETHPEFEIRHNYLNQHFHQILDLLKDIDFRTRCKLRSLLPQLVILNEELRTVGPWNNEKCKEYSQKLNCTFDMIHETTLDNLFKSQFKVQELFDNCMKVLHHKITSETYRYYPSLIEVYCTLIQNIKDYKITKNTSAILPISLLLIDDCLNVNKIKGLKCCEAVLLCLTPFDFVQGNYYEVVYESLKKSITEKDIEVTKLVLDNFLQLLTILPIDAKKAQTDKLFTIIVDQLYIESNLYRKAVCFKFTKSIIQIHGVNCLNKSIFKELMWENVDICTNDAVADILLTDVLECLEVWIQYCWCIWRLSTDQKLLSNLFKLLYVCKENYVQKIQKLILTLISLCTKEEQKKLQTNLEMPLQLPNKEFIQRLAGIKKEINV